MARRWQARTLTYQNAAHVLWASQYPRWDWFDPLNHWHGITRQRLTEALQRLQQRERQHRQPILLPSDSPFLDWLGDQLDGEGDHGA